MSRLKAELLTFSEHEHYTFCNHVSRNVFVRFQEGVSAQPTEITVHIQQDGAAPDRDVFIDDDSGSGLGIDEASGSGWGPGPGVDDEDGRGSGDGAVRPALSGLPEDDEDFAPRTTVAPGTPAPPEYPDLPEPDNALPNPTAPEPTIPTPKVQQPDLVSRE